MFLRCSMRAADGRSAAAISSARCRAGKSGVGRILLFRRVCAWGGAGQNSPFVPSEG
jgi:hypothetical protein